MLFMDITHQSMIVLIIKKVCLTLDPDLHAAMMDKMNTISLLFVVNKN